MSRKQSPNIVTSNGKFKGDVSLEFLSNIQTLNKSAWTITKASVLVDAVRKYVERNEPIDYDGVSAKLSSCGIKASKYTIQNVLRELRNAGRVGMTVGEYMLGCTKNGKTYGPRCFKSSVVLEKGK